jgi:hypothetical protein
MRALKMILGGLFAALAIAVAIAAGFVATAILGAIGLTVYLVRRLLGRPRATPLRSVPNPQARSAASSDAIDVTAVEVPAEPTERRLTD